MQGTVAEREREGGSVYLDKGLLTGAPFFLTIRKADMPYNTLFDGKKAPLSPVKSYFRGK